MPFAREKVFALMSDWRNLQHWDMNIVKSDYAEPDSDYTNGVGTKYDCAFKVGDRAPIDVAYECIRYDTPQFCKYQGMATLFKSFDSIQCDVVADSADKTEITAEFNLDFRGLLSPFSFVMNGQMQNTGPLIMKDIEKFVTTSLEENEEKGL